MKQPHGARGNGQSLGKVLDGDRVNGGDRARRVHGPSSVPKRLYTMREAGFYLGVSYWTIRSYVESGQLRAVRLPGGGKLLRIELAELERLVEACREG